MAQMIYDVNDTPRTKELIVFAIQQLLAIIAGTITVPILVGLPEMIPAAILGCGLGTLAYIFITKRKSPVILSSNFAFIFALKIAYEHSGYLGIVLGGILVGLVYITLSIIIRKVGTGWIDKFLPPIIIGPVVALIGLTLATSAMADIVKANGYVENGIYPYNLIALLCGLVTFFVVIVCSSQKRNKFLNFTPFLIGIIAGYMVSLIFSIIGYAFDLNYFKIIDFNPLLENFKNVSVTSFIDYPKFSLLEGIKEVKNNNVLLSGFGVLEVMLAFIPISLVSFSEHIADHKNLSSIIGHDLLKDEPGLHRTLLGDGIGSLVGTSFGISPITTYSQSVGCVALTKNASVKTMILTSIFCIVLAFLSPFIALIQTIPSCVMAGICLALYGFIAVSGLKMLSGIKFDEGKNLYTLSVILIAGVGGFILQIPYKFGLITGTNLVGAIKYIEISEIAVALILGIITYLVSSKIENSKLGRDKDDE